jgi:hypothetical protein
MSRANDARPRGYVWALLGLALGFDLSACTDAKKTDFENFCHAEERSGAANPAMGAEGKQRLMATWLAERLRTPEGQAMFRDMSAPGLDRAAKRNQLREAAAKAGVTPCPMAEDGPSSPTPP